MSAYTQFATEEDETILHTAYGVAFAPAIGSTFYDIAGEPWEVVSTDTNAAKQRSSQDIGLAILVVVKPIRLDAQP